MSSKTSSRSTLTTVPSTMSPSLKYLMVRSIAARKSSAEPMSLTATCGVVEVASVLLVMCGLAPDTDMSRCLRGGPVFVPAKTGDCGANPEETDVDRFERVPAPSEGPQAHSAAISICDIG